jgi:tight adherence protein B
VNSVHLVSVTWSALGLALLLAPVGSSTVQRARVLSGEGRLHDVRPLRRDRWTPEVVPALVLGVLVLATAVGITRGVALGLSAGVAAATVARLGLVWQRGRASMRDDVQLLAALRLLVAELDAGGRPDVALRAAAECAGRHALALDRAADEAGRGLEPAFGADEALDPLAHAWRVAAGSGARLAGVVGQAADDLAARIAQRRAVGASVAGARSSAAMLAMLPAVGLLLGSALQAHPLHLLLATSSGHLLCLGGIVLDAAGLMWVQRLTARAERAP